jgi:aspartyl aminopeptidase
MISEHRFCNAIRLVSHTYYTRSCGSTVGPMLSKIGIRTVDVGNAMLSMHSIRETAGSHDIQSAIDLFTSFFEDFAELDKQLAID